MAFGCSLGHWDASFCFETNCFDLLTDLLLFLQGKDEFERQQKKLLEKENITKQSKVQLEQEQVNDTYT